MEGVESILSFAWLLYGNVEIRTADNEGKEGCKKTFL